MNLTQLIQDIAVKAVRGTSPMAFFSGEVTSSDPLKIRLEGTMELEKEDLILTEPVIEKKLIIKKHTHEIGETISSHKHVVTGECSQGGAIETVSEKSESLTTSTKVVDTVLEAKTVENQIDLPVESDNDKITVTLNRGLEVGDKVIMVSCESGQQFIVLSRVF